MDQVVVKSNYEGDIRRITVDTAIEFDNLVEILRQLYQKPSSPVRLQWKDPEGDMILVTTDLELRDAFRLAMSEGTTPVLRISVTFYEPTAPGADEAVGPEPNEDAMETEKEEKQPTAPPQPCCAAPGAPAVDLAQWGQMGFEMLRQYWPDIEQHVQHWQQQMQQGETGAPCEQGGHPFRDFLSRGGWGGRGRGGPHRGRSWGRGGQRLGHGPRGHGHPGNPEGPPPPPPPPWNQIANWFSQWQSGPVRVDESNLNARFVKHETLYDGTEVQADSECMKIWRVRNEGTAPWPANTKLVWVSGDLLSADGKESNVPVTNVGDEVDVALGLKIPPRAGRYVSLWKLVTPSGVRFGQELKIDILVVAAPNALSVRLDGQADSAFVRHDAELTPDEIAAAVEEIDMASQPLPEGKPLPMKKKD